MYITLDIQLKPPWKNFLNSTVSKLIVIADAQEWSMEICMHLENRRTTAHTKTVPD